ncbi:MAG: Ig-like domain-containing protein [Polyangiaceae bacterium]|nr:Ig-like domain-containing protein [Polyangiaceae bacterium]
MAPSNRRFVRSRGVFLALATMVLVPSCFSGTQAPDGPPKNQLNLSSEPDARPDKGPFGVVFSGPRGENLESPEISVVFNRPMVPLELAGNEAPPPIKLTPAVKGRWQWVGTSAVTFVPETHLPRATQYTVQIPKGAKSLAGDILDKDVEWKFSTLRPKVLRVDSTEPLDHLSPKSTFTLWLNQPVDAVELSKQTTLFANDNPPIAFDLKQKDGDNDRVFTLTPKSNLPLDSHITIKVASELHGKEGPLDAEGERLFQMETYGPLTITNLDCSNNSPREMCDYSGGLRLQTSNQVTLGALKKAVRIEPALPIHWSSWMGDDEESNYFYLGAAFKPGKRYTVTVASAGLKDEYGQSLGGDYTKPFDFGDVWPSAELGVAGTFIEPGATSEIPVYVVNSDDAQFAYAPLTEADVMQLETGTSSRAPTFQSVADRAGAKVKSLPPSATLNAVSRHAVKIEDILGKNGRGPIQLAVQYTYRPGSRYSRRVEDTRIVHVTDLAITAKISRDGSLVWVSRLSTGAPVPNARVRLRWQDGEAAGQHTTDKDGFVRFEKAEFSPVEPHQEDALIIVNEGTDWTYRPVREVLDGWRFGASASFSEEPTRGLVFTDAGIYRPGDTVHIKGIIREPVSKGLATPAGKAVQVTVGSFDGQTIADVERKLSPFGTFDADVVIPEGTRLGTFSIHTALNDPQSQGLDSNAYATFEVAEYRPAELKVAIETNKPSYVRGDAFECTVKGNYLYGAPVANGSTRVHITRNNAGFSPPGIDDYTISDEPYSYDLPDKPKVDENLHSSRATLDSKGITKVNTNLTLPGQTGPETVTCEAEVADISRQVVGGVSAAIVHPGEYYVALNSGDDYFLSTTDPVKPQILTVDPKGQKLPGKSVKVELIQRTWTTARQKTASGALHRVSTPVDKVVSTCTVTSALSPVSCTLKSANAGYYIVRASSQDSRKNNIASSSSLYVVGDSSSGWRDSDSNILELDTDKDTYDVGQNARVLIKSPFPTAEALITVERSGVYRSFRQTVRGAMPSISIPVTDDIRPNAFVSVLLVRGRSKAPPKDVKGADVGAPAFRFGVTQISVDPEARRLAVKLTPDAADKRPGQEVSVAADVHDAKGKPVRAEVTLYAVDEGVLSLIKYETPDPIETMNEPRPLRVATLETRDALARTFNPFAGLGLDKGKDGGGGADDKGISFRRDFRTSPYFNASLVTDDKGHTSAKFKLPESLTTYRLMAVVTAEDDRFGYAQSFVTTSRPLMARPALPRFLRAGDTIDAGIVLTSKGLAKNTYQVQLAAEGVSLKGSSEQSVELDSGQSAEVRFQMAASRVGTAKLRFTAKGGGEEDRVEVVRTIHPPLALEAVALYGDTADQSVEALGNMSGMRDDTGGLTISTSSSALIGLDAGVEQLIEYPYGCTEQLTSRLVPLLPLRDLANDYGFVLPKNVDKMVAETIPKILAHQKPDGGFGLWAESTESSAWFTAYALWGLTQAEKRGIKVSPNAIQAATDYLGDAIERVANDPWNRASIPFMLDVLAERGHPDLPRMGAWFDSRAQLPLFAKAQLLHAMAVGKADRKSMDILATELETALRLDGPTARVVSNHGDSYAILLDSDTRTAALVLRGLVAAKPDHPMASKLVFGLLDDRKGGTWRSTQETAWALLAIDDYRKTQEKKAPNFMAHIFFNNAEVGSHRFEGRSLHQATTTLPAGQVVTQSGAPLGFKVDGEGKLFYQARLRYAKKELPKTPLDRGFFVSKTVRAIAPEDLSQDLGLSGKPGSTTFLGGDLVLGEVTVVTTTPRNFVVIEDPLPAGFEAIDARLATTVPSLNVDNRGDYDDSSEEEESEDYDYSSFVREVRDDRVLFFVDHLPAGMYRYRYLARATTFGTFVLPPTRAEEMYAPEVFGRTAAGSIAVNIK